MVKNQYDFEKFDTLFHPIHIAFIGASENSKFGSMLYLTAFKNSKWSDTFYPVNPNKDKILEWKCYHSVLDIPYPVDTVYVSVKTNFIVQVIKECVQKKVPWVIIFASGFSETGDEKGKELEQEVKSVLKGSSTRVIGPNCLGPFNAETGMAFSFAALKGALGSVSFMSQSGGHLSQLVDVGFKRDIRFRYGLSFGNQIDVNCTDVLKHFGSHDKTSVVACYLESFGSSRGHDFFEELKVTTKKKPVVLWKGGYTEEGSRAAFSHTGAIASNERLWKTMAKQTGSTLVRDNEEFWNTLKTFELLFPKYLPKGRNVGIITPGGGASVNLTDLFASYNLRVPLLTEETQQAIAKILPEVNVNIKNPIDLGAVGFVTEVFTECTQLVVNDPNIDIIAVPFWPDHVFTYVFKRMIKIQKSTTKPFAICLPSIADESALATRFQNGKKSLHKERVLYYFSLRDAAKSLSLLCDYADYLRTHNYSTKQS